ncbi:hypothetical protein N0V94_001318 [Neodidymelliopsis sp. IMI 364377]|nr:hypothetical protein N0V94_001318 [Neodidymelliopsis sp. IMI 364377]
MFYPPLHMQNFQRTNDKETQQSIYEIAKVLSSLAGNPESETVMLGRRPLEGAATGGEFTLDKHNVEKSRRLVACFVAQQILRYDRGISQAAPAQLNLPDSKTSDEDYETTHPGTPAHYAIHITFRDKTATLLSLSFDLIGYRKRSFSSRPPATRDIDSNPWFMSWD